MNHRTMHKANKKFSNKKGNFYGISQQTRERESDFVTGEEENWRAKTGLWL